MLYVHTNLAATLKVELRPQEQDLQRCEKFVESLLFRARMYSYPPVNSAIRK
jgi:flavodoxin I